MSTFINRGEKKVIALYLPQFHTIPENDKWWGTGFTEWTNTKKATPLFEGHYQPKTPLNENYYDLSDVTVMEHQADMAKKYGVYAFCYYHYWFKNGKKLLEKPIENMLKNPKVDIPFCLCWANENWSKNWDGGNREVIMEQDYGTKRDWEKHFLYLLAFFKDPRYIIIENKPLLVIYKPEQINKLNAMIDYWRKRCREEGFDGIVIVRQFPNSMYDPNFDDSRIDYSVKFEPASTQAYRHYCINKKPYLVPGRKENIKRIIKSLLPKEIVEKTRRHPAEQKLTIEYYDDAWDIILNQEPCNDKLINGAFVDWDNTARNVNGRMYLGASPQKFKKYMTALLKKESALDLIFINAWNEWAEGAYLEPDEKYQYAYLEALREAIVTAGETK